MIRFVVPLLALNAMACLAAADTQVIGFEDLALAAESFWNGPDPAGETVDGQFGPERIGAFASGGTVFANVYDLAYDSWRGFAYSNTVDTTTSDYTNQFSAYPGAGADASATYAVGFGYHDTQPTGLKPVPFDPSNASHLNDLPTLELPFGRQVRSVAITNTTYTALSVLHGDGFAKKFGGESGGDPDWLKVTAYGTDAAGAPLGIAVDYYLADYRSPDAAADYVVDAWEEWDLSSLAGASRIHFNVFSSDVGLFGLNTPTYFALDNLTLSVDVTPGDFNLDGHVDAADYTLWRDTFEESVARRGAGADGDLSGVIDQADREVWRSHYSPQTVAVSAPEPTTLCFVAIAALLGFAGRRIV